MKHVRPFQTQFTHQLLSAKSTEVERKITIAKMTLPAGDKGRQQIQRVGSAINGLIFSWRDGPLTGKMRAQWFFVSFCEPIRDGNINHDKFWDLDLLHPTDRPGAQELAAAGEIRLRPYTHAAFGTCSLCGMPTRRIGRYQCLSRAIDSGNVWELEFNSLCLKCPVVSPMGLEYYQKWLI